MLKILENSYKKIRESSNTKKIHQISLTTVTAAGGERSIPKL
jgi:hypothetical protein